MQNHQLELAYRFGNYTGENIVLTGTAGTGKTTFLHSIKNNGLKRMVVVAPTGVAAINAGGVTIHSFFQMPFGPIVPGTSRNPEFKSRNRDYINRRFNKEKINIIKSMDLLVIDEISMVRADLLDGIDEVLRRYRNPDRAFGGVQLLMIGDLEQLAPIVREEEWELLRDHYENAFFFSSKSLKQTNFVSIVLEHVYRQSDQDFIDLLNKVRNKTFDADTLAELNKRFKPGFIEENHEGYIILTTHNAQSQRINQDRLESLEEESEVFYAKIEGDFPEHSYPTEPELELKVGAQVMFVKNDLSKEKRYFNGKIGIIEEIEDDTIFIQCEGEDDVIDVDPVMWENMKYTLDD
ncbi:MAG: ATP-dependent DNA helicase, partial [Bacteroidales bacterium]